jgi:predicted DNA-binding transcriptional regulator AlpA
MVLAETGTAVPSQILLNFNRIHAISIRATPYATLLAQNPPGKLQLRQPLTDFANRITGWARLGRGDSRNVNEGNGAMAELPRFVKVEDLMKMFDVKAASTIYGWENDGFLPPSYKPGGPDGHRRWLLSEVLEYIKCRREQPAA